VKGPFQEMDQTL